MRHERRRLSDLRASACRALPSLLVCTMLSGTAQATPGAFDGAGFLPPTGQHDYEAGRGWAPIAGTLQAGRPVGPGGRLRAKSWTGRGKPPQLMFVCIEGVVGFKTNWPETPLGLSQGWPVAIVRTSIDGAPFRMTAMSFFGSSRDTLGDIPPSELPTVKLGAATIEMFAPRIREVDFDWRPLGLARAIAKAATLELMIETDGGYRRAVFDVAGSGSVLDWIWAQCR